MRKLLAGSGGGMSGGKGGSRQRQQPVTQSQEYVAYTPTEAKNSLFSTSYAKIVDLIAEGEIQGLKNGYQSIFLDNTPLQNPDGTYNFSNVIVETRPGTQGQSYIPGFEQIANEVSVNVSVRQATPVVRTVTDSTVNAVRVTVSLPALQESNSKGDILGSSVDLDISLQYNGGGYTVALSDTISGRTNQPYQRQYIVPISGAFPVDVRVRRLTQDSSSSNIANAFSWTSYTEVTYAKLAYPNSALIALRIDAEQFNNVPSRSYIIRGQKVRIPSNGTVDSTTGRIVYSGIWDGTFGAAQWTNDPAWCLWDLLVTKRYGVGDHLIESQLDKWAFYSASQYCSTLVPDGFGGYEPRFSCNINIQTAEEVYKVINDLCSVFRVMPYWGAGSITVSQDKPADSAYLFTYANVDQDSGFTYSSSSLKSRPTVAVVQYFDNDMRDTAYEPVEDQEGIKKFGIIKTEITAIACTSRGQAHRLGKWLLYTENNEYETCAFTTSVDAGVVVRPGAIIEISDPVRAGTRRGGRISAATLNSVTVDNVDGISVVGGSTLSVVAPNGTVQTVNALEINGNTIAVAPPFASIPNVNSIWTLDTPDLQTSLWRVLSIVERDDAKYDVSCLSYNASKYNHVENDLALEYRDITNLNEIPDSPENLVAAEVLYESGSRALSKLIVSWSSVPGVNSYRISWKSQNSNWTTETIRRTDYEILDTSEGVYDIGVSAVNAGLRTSVPSELKVITYGKTAPPTTPTGLSLIPIDGASAILSWDLAPDLDVRVGGKVLIRHSIVTTGATWENSQDLVPSAAGNQTQKQIPLLTGTVLLKFQDDTGNRSVNAASVVTTLPTPLPRYTVTTYAEELESPPFSGNYTNMVYSSDLGGLILATGTAIDSMALDGNWDALGNIDAIGGAAGSGEYEFGSTYDMGAIFDVNMIRRFATYPYLPASLWDDKLENIDDWGTVDETGLDRVNASLYVRSTNDNPAGTPTWSPWREFANAIVKARGFQFKMMAESTDSSQNIVVTELGCKLELQQRVEASATITTTTAPYNVTFANRFYTVPSVGITAYNMDHADDFTITNVTTTGFTIAFRQGGSHLARTFVYNAVGYGKGE
jgi:hypothetical protein